MSFGIGRLHEQYETVYKEKITSYASHWRTGQWKQCCIKSHIKGKGVKSSLQPYNPLLGWADKLCWILILQSASSLVLNFDSFWRGKKRKEQQLVGANDLAIAMKKCGVNATGSQSPWSMHSLKINSVSVGSYWRIEDFQPFKHKKS